MCKGIYRYIYIPHCGLSAGGADCLFHSLSRFRPRFLSVDLEEMGRRAVHAISERLRSPRKAHLPPKREVLEAELVITSSCRIMNHAKIDLKQDITENQEKERT